MGACVWGRSLILNTNVVFVRVAPSNLAPLSVSVVSHPCSPGAPAVHSVLLLVLERWSLCSGPRPDAVERLRCTRSVLSPLRNNQIYNQAQGHASISQVWQVFNQTDRNYESVHTIIQSSLVNLNYLMHCPSLYFSKRTVFFFPITILIFYSEISNNITKQH